MKLKKWMDIMVNKAASEEMAQRYKEAIRKMLDVIENE